MSILGALFGGSKSKSGSENRAFPQLQQQLTPAIGTGTNALNQLGGELSGGFDQFKRNSGFNFALGEGLEDVAGANAARGTLNSGIAGKGYQRYATGLTNQFYNNYLGQLGQTSGLGLQAANTLTGAGQQSTSSGKSQNGILPTLFSDRRLKEDVVRIGKLDNGLPLYSYRMVGKHERQIGLMADEVAQVHPEAVKQHGDYLTVDYEQAVK